MNTRKALEQELASLALAVADKSNEQAAQALWDLYSKFTIHAAEENLRAQFASANHSLEAQLQARLAALTEESEPVAAPVAPEVAAPANPKIDTSTPQVEPVAQKISEKAPEVEPTAQKAPEQTPEVEPATPAQDLFEAPVAQEPAETESAPAAVQGSVQEKAQLNSEKKSLNDRLAGTALKFGLNDRIGFVKELFDGSAEDFNRVVSQLNTLGSLSEAQDFLQTHIAPEYGWANNEETAERFMAAVEQRFG